VILMVIAALLAPLIAPQKPYDIASLNLADARRPPGYVGSGGYVHWLWERMRKAETFFSAILYGLRISMEMGLLAGLTAIRGWDRARRFWRRIMAD